MIYQEQLGLGMFKNESNRFGIKARVHSIENRTGHGHPEVGLKHRRYIWRYNRYGITGTNAALLQSAGQPSATRMGLRPSMTNSVCHQRNLIGIDQRRSFQKADRGEGDKICGVLRQPFGVYVLCHFSSS